MMPGAINFSGRHETSRSAGARADVRQRVGGVGLKLRPYSAPVGGWERLLYFYLHKPSAATAVYAFDHYLLPVSRPTSRCHKSQFDFRVSVTVN